MTLRYHGNWCGPGWSAGKYKDAKDLTDSELSVPAIDGLDALCKRHDINIRNAKTKKDIQEAHKMFMEGAAQYGIKGRLAAVAVGLFGPKEPTSYSEHARLNERLEQGIVLPHSDAARSMRQFRRQAFPKGKSFVNYRHAAKVVTRRPAR